MPAPTRQGGALPARLEAPLIPLGRSRRPASDVPFPRQGEPFPTPAEERGRTHSGDWAASLLRGPNGSTQAPPPIPFQMPFVRQGTEPFAPQAFTRSRGFGSARPPGGAGRKTSPWVRDCEFYEVSRQLATPHPGREARLDQGSAPPGDPDRPRNTHRPRALRDGEPAPESAGAADSQAPT